MSTLDHKYSQWVVLGKKNWILDNIGQTRIVQSADWAYEFVLCCAMPQCHALLSSLKRLNYLVRVLMSHIPACAICTHSSSAFWWSLTRFTSVWSLFTLFCRFLNIRTACSALTVVPNNRESELNLLVSISDEIPVDDSVETRLCSWLHFTSGLSWHGQ